MTQPLKSAVKSDGYKIRHELMTSAFREAVSRVLTFGAEKYDAHNWAKGFDWSRLIGACERHLEAFKGGEDWDQETGEHHLAHLGCEVMFLLEHSLRGLGQDDRLRLPALLPVPPDVLERRAAALASAKAAKGRQTPAAPCSSGPILTGTWQGYHAEDVLSVLAALTQHSGSAYYFLGDQLRNRDTNTGSLHHPAGLVMHGLRKRDPAPECTAAPGPATTDPGAWRLYHADCFLTCGTPTSCGEYGCKALRGDHGTPVGVKLPAAPAFDVSDVEADGHITVHPKPAAHGAHWCAATHDDGRLCERPPYHEGAHRAGATWWATTSRL